MTKPELTVASSQYSLKVPLEIIDRIIELAISAVDSDNHVGTFSAIECLSLASSTFRKMAFRHYMRNIAPRNRCHWKNLFKFLEVQTEAALRRNEKGGFVWVKFVYAIPFRATTSAYIDF
jgi:hypothetical protein